MLAKGLQMSVGTIVGNTTSDFNGGLSPSGYVILEHTNITEMEVGMRSKENKVFRLTYATYMWTAQSQAIEMGSVTAF
jgi:hypothetical protein